MKDRNGKSETINILTVLLIIFIELKLIDFSNMGALDYIILVFLGVYIILIITSMLRK
ncbi:hypothetical protein [Anaerosacchariphilus polymeriproducens]|uniref:hypothetical protein n=1 Tax=Anaerosacchariphilus polymeriproducens TaxID=1812858 RepID=UPI0012D7099F|nr:hypothetical protein [Anaerosacchariphilus polymeriproducens]